MTSVYFSVLASRLILILKNILKPYLTTANPEKEFISLASSITLLGRLSQLLACKIKFLNMASRSGFEPL